MEVRLNKVCKSYDKKEVIKDLDLELASGELLSLVGPSGCGKSTILYMISGLEPVSGGKIYFGEEDVTSLGADKRDIGLVFQNYALYPHMSVLENIMFPLKNQKINKEEAKKLALDVIKTVGLKDHAHKKPGQLSGGQQQRVAIARAIVKKPKVLLLDEPLSNLDAKLKASTILEIRAIQKKYNITTIFVTHDQQEALAVSDKIAIIKDGKVEQIGEPNELYRNPKSAYVAEFIGSPSINFFNITIKDKQATDFAILGSQEINVPDGEYRLGIRPESFLLNSPSGVELAVEDLEVLGRDLLLHTHIGNQSLRIIDRNIGANDYTNTVKVYVAKENIYLFDQENNTRVYEQ